MIELTNKRTADSKTFDIGEGKRRWEKHAGSIHYESEGAWHEIDCNIIPSDRPNWDWEVTKGHWTILIKNDTTIAIGKDGNWIGYRFDGVGYYRPTTSDYEILFARGAITPVVSNNKIRWEGIVPGVNIEYIYTTDGFKENIEVTQVARNWLAAHPPSTYGIPNNEAFIGGYFECDWANAYSAENKDGLPIDFDNDLDIQDTIFWKHPITQKIVSFLPVGRAFIEDDILTPSVNMRSRFFKYNDKNWLLAGAKITELNALPTGTFILDPTTYTNQAATKDTNLVLGSPTTNYGSTNDIQIASNSILKYHALIEFDISALPDGVVIDSSTLSLYYYGWWGANPSGTTDTLYRLQRADWVELQATWNIYKTGSNWTTAGAQDTTDDIDISLTETATIPANYPAWVNFTGSGMKALVEDAIANRSDKLIMRLHTAFTTFATHYFYSRNYGTAALRPLLSIDYEVGGFAHSQGIMI